MEEANTTVDQAALVPDDWWWCEVVLTHQELQISGGGQDTWEAVAVVVEDLITPSLDPLHPVVVVEFLL